MTSHARKSGSTDNVVEDGEVLLTDIYVDYAAGFESPSEVAVSTGGGISETDVSSRKRHAITSNHGKQSNKRSDSNICNVVESLPPGLTKIFLEVGLLRHERLPRSCRCSSRCCCCCCYAQGNEKMPIDGPSRYASFFYLLILPVSGFSNLQAEVSKENPFSCSKTLVFSPDKPQPCLQMISSVFAPFVAMTIGVPIVYWWLRKNALKNARSLAFRGDMARIVKDFSTRLVKYLVIVRALLIIITFITFFVLFVEAPSSQSATEKIALAVLKSASQTVAIMYIWHRLVVLFLAVVILYYAETRHLRHSLKDVTTLVKERPFNFATAAPAYCNMANEWEESQRRIGPVANVIAVCLISQICSAFVSLVYMSKSTEISDDTTASHTESTPAISAGIGIFDVVTKMTYIVIFLLLVSAMMSANDRVQGIAK